MDGQIAVNLRIKETVYPIEIKQIVECCAPVLRHRDLDIEQ